MYVGFVKGGKRLNFNGYLVYQEIQMLDQFIFIQSMKILKQDIWEKWIPNINLIIKE